MNIRASRRSQISAIVVSGAQQWIVTALVGPGHVARGGKGVGEGIVLRAVAAAAEEEDVLPVPRLDEGRSFDQTVVRDASVVEEGDGVADGGDAVVVNGLEQEWGWDDGFDLRALIDGC